MQDELAINTLKAQLKKLTKELNQSKRHEAAARAEPDDLTVQAASLREENDVMIAESIRAQNLITDKEEQFVYMNNQNMALQQKVTSLTRDKSHGRYFVNMESHKSFIQIQAVSLGTLY